MHSGENCHCQITGKKRSPRNKIVAHHLESWAANPDLREDPNNGVTILKSLHELFHKQYGHGNNTTSQFLEFKLEKQKQLKITP